MPPWERMARMERIRCWFVPMRPVTPFMMMPLWWVLGDMVEEKRRVGSVNLFLIGMAVSDYTNGSFNHVFSLFGGGE